MDIFPLLGKNGANAAAMKAQIYPLAAVLAVLLAACGGKSQPEPKDAKPPEAEAMPEVKPDSKPEPKPTPVEEVEPKPKPEQQPAAAEGSIHVGETDITFVPPSGFEALPQEIIDQKWPNNRAPRFVVGNEGAGTTVAYDLKPNQVRQDELPEMQEQFVNLFERIIPGLEWKKKEIVEHSGQKWVFLEMTSQVVDTDIYNIMMVTGFGDEMLVFNFNSTREEFPKYEDQLRASLKSIKLP